MIVNFLKSLGSPRRFYYLCNSLYPWCLGLSLVLLGYGLVGGLYLAPADYQQGDGFRIIYVHVPCAILSLAIYAAMAFYSLLYLIWRVKVADVVAYSIAPIGAFFTACALITGALWGKPMWGTWWIWDARLTCELLLLFLYLGYIALYGAIGQNKAAAKACAILALVGVLDVPIIHYSVNWWNTLHQGQTLQWGKPTMALSMFYPLLAMLIGMALYTVCVACLRIKSEILKREAQNQWVVSLLKARSPG